MSNFNWQTDDEIHQDELLPAPKTAGSHRRYWKTYGLIAIVVIASLTLIFEQIDQRIEASMATRTYDSAGRWRIFRL